MRAPSKPYRIEQDNERGSLKKTINHGSFLITFF